jgi:hypothetical protein
MPPQSQELEERKVQFIFSDGVSRLYRRILKLLKIISLLLPRLLKCIVNSCLLFGFSCRMRSLRSNCRGGSEGAVPRLIPLLPSLPHCVTATIFRDSAFRRSHWDPHGAERERERKRERERERERKKERERKRERERERRNQEQKNGDWRRDRRNSLSSFPIGNRVRGEMYPYADRKKSPESCFISGSRVHPGS